MNIRHDIETHKFYAIVEGKVCTLEYSVAADGKTLNYRATFVPRELRGRHIGEHLVKFALDYAKTHNYKVIPTCQFVKHIMERNPEYETMVKNQLKIRLNK